MLTRNADDSWDAKLISQAHKTGVNAVSWAPATTGGTIASGGQESAVMRLVSGGCDNMVKLWRMNEAGEWESEAELQLHNDWVRRHRDRVGNRR